MKNLVRIIGCVLIAQCLSCSTQVPKDALEFRPDTLERRILQSRRFETGDEASLLAASIGVLQDLGFNIDEGEHALGVVVGSKDRDATSAGQIAGAVALSLLTGVMIATDDEQKIRASVVTKPQSDTQTSVRVTFQRIVWNDRGLVSKTQSIEDPEIYQGFFEKLSKSVFLEAQQI